ncbi:uncharacterized protein LOC127733888 isoform X1 [Mytilus californianus]|uniref:uncharacterized protein LOC127733888 isoform X1 n=1 Tax=Mytilus californianus TaxID=6549 RepID=UPI00224660EC|nr:uncharacterized protein LOC127733888 isoform X1 [Mytilus californianus]
MQSNYSSVIYQRNSTHGLDSNTAASKSPTMQTSGNREPPDGAAPSINSQNSSDTNLKNIVDRDNGDEGYLFSSLNRNDVVVDNSGQNTSNSTDNQLNIDSLVKKSHVCLLPPEQLVRQNYEHLNSQHDSEYAPSLDLHSVTSDHQETNGFITFSIGINRPNANSGAPLTNNTDGYKSINDPATNIQGAALLWTKMRRMLPAARSTMKNTVGIMIESVNFVQKSDQSFI